MRVGHTCEGLMVLGSCRVKTLRWCETMTSSSEVQQLMNTTIAQSAASTPIGTFFHRCAKTRAMAAPPGGSANWLPCDGQAYKVEGYPKLYAQIGNSVDPAVPEGTFKVPGEEDAAGDFEFSWIFSGPKEIPDPKVE